MIPGLNAKMPVQIHHVENGWIVDINPYQGNPFKEMAKTMTRELNKDEKLHPKDEDDIFSSDPFEQRLPLVFVFKEFTEVLAFLQKCYAP